MSRVELSQAIPCSGKTAYVVQARVADETDSGVRGLSHPWVSSPPGKVPFEIGGGEPW